MLNTRSREKTGWTQNHYQWDGVPIIVYTPKTKVQNTQRNKIQNTRTTTRKPRIKLV